MNITSTMDTLLTEAVKAHRRPDAFHIGECLRPHIERQLMWCLNFANIDKDIDMADYYKNVECFYSPGWFGITLITRPEQ